MPGNAGRTQPPAARTGRGNRNGGRVRARGSTSGSNGSTSTVNLIGQRKEADPPCTPAFQNSTISHASGQLEMNADLPERFRGKRQPMAQDSTTIPESDLDVSLNTGIRDYIAKQDAVAGSTKSSTWLSLPELPTNAEISVKGDEDVLLAPNKIRGKWKSKEKYLRAHYELLREDAISPLRDAVDTFRENPDMNDDHGVCIYEKVHLAGLTFSQIGIAARVHFSTIRAGRKILWGSSKRLTSGTAVALTPSRDKFASKCVVALVAARPLQGVESTPCEIDIYFARPEDIEIDPQEEWLMIEAKTGYYEAYRHTLKAVQKLSNESFPLSDYICSLSSDIEAPDYIRRNPYVDLSAVVDDFSAKKPLAKVDVLNQWPAHPEGTLDKTQWAAMNHILTQRLAVIQGPPGTGKTFVSKIALQILVENRADDDPPIIIAAQTNHALDQLLGHVSYFDPNYIRLGGRSTNPEVKQRALYEVRQKERIPLIPGGMLGRATHEIRLLANRIIEILEPLNRASSEPFSARLLFQLGIISQAQYQSLESGAAEWVTAAETPETSIQSWAFKSLLPFHLTYKKDNFGFSEEDEDLEFEQLREVEAENGVADDEDIEMIKGQWCRLQDRFTVQLPSASVLDKAKKQLDTLDDLWKVPDYLRGPMYSVMQAKVKTALLVKVREAAEEYDKIAKNLKIGKWERDAVFLKRANIIGLTTTGLSKYRPLIASLKPKIILIEEAAEVIEAPVTVACVESLEHLVLVGDHQQLQGHCSVSELENEPYYLNVSMFERLVKNSMPFKTLLRQRRMDPEFRRLLTPIYPRLEDHPVVVGRPALTVGMGNKKSFFFDHEWAEDKDGQLSTFNDKEALFIAEFYKHLLQNRCSPQDITILTFYNGQRKRILKYLRADPKTKELYNNVKTVDSYQGEENVIVILSLVRSNDNNKIGFLEIDNRVCVALSRAKFGFYLFGNAQLLANASPLWKDVVDIMSENPVRIGDTFPIQCQKHGRTTHIMYPEDWATKTDGGCSEPCEGALDCGHACTLLCHPYAHSELLCLRKCERVLVCGHLCSKVCYEPCFCDCEAFSQAGGWSNGPSDGDEPGYRPEPSSPWGNGSGTRGNSMPPPSFRGPTDVRGNNTFNKNSKNQQHGQKAQNKRHQDQILAHVPNNGKAQASIASSLTIAPRLSPKFGPASSSTHNSFKPPSTSASFASESTPRSNSSYFATYSHSSQHSFGRQDQGVKGWTDYSKGGVKNDDQNRDRQSKIGERVETEKSCEEVEVSLMDLEIDSSPIKNEKVKELTNGRKIWKQEMQPAGSKLKMIGFGFGEVARIDGASSSRSGAEKLLKSSENCLVEL